MRRILAIALAFALFLPATAARLGAQAQLASLAGTATSSTGDILANVAVQLRDLATGQLVGTTTSTATGTFSFAGLQAGNFAVEVVSAAGNIVGTSASVGVAAGASVTGVTVSASAAAVAGAAGGVAGATAGAVGGGTAAATTTATIVTTTAAAGGAVAGSVATQEDASVVQ